MSNPEISVILPVYNGGAYLKKSVDSVLSQNFESFELVVLDDCSDDGSWEYLQSLTDRRLTLRRNAVNKGLFYNLNQLVEMSSAPLIKLWAQDDLMYNNCLQSFVDFHRRNHSLGFSYCARDIIDQQGVMIRKYEFDDTPEIISPERHAKIAFRTGSISGNIASLCIVRTALESVGPFKEYMTISADFDMQVRLAQNHDTGFIKQALVQLRHHDRQLSQAPQYYLRHVQEDMEVYGFLLGYVSPDLQHKGRTILRQNKLLFYYTLMLKALLSGQFKLANGYYKLLSDFDNFFQLSLSFLKRKILRFS